MSVAAKLHWFPPQNRRQDRYKVVFGLTLHEADGTAIDVQVENMSLTGIKLRSRRQLPIGGRAWLGIPGLGDYQIEIVRREGDFYGCKLDRPLGFETAAHDGADDVVVSGRFAPRPEAFLHLPGQLDVDVDKWPRSVRSRMMIGVPLALWLTMAGAWFLAG